MDENKEVDMKSLNKKSLSKQVIDEIINLNDRSIKAR